MRACAGRSRTSPSAWIEPEVEDVRQLLSSISPLTCSPPSRLYSFLWILPTSSSTRSPILGVALPSIAEVTHRRCIRWYQISRTRHQTYCGKGAIELIRTFAAIGSQKRGSPYVACLGTVPLSERVMRAFVTVAEQPDDPFRPITVQT
jgi:hypothetical protein